MDTKTFFTLYAKYYDAIDVIASFPLNEEITLDKTGLRRAVVQSIYRDIAKYNFSGGLQNFFGPIALGFMQTELSKKQQACKDGCAWESLKEILEMDIRWTKIFMRFFARNPAHALSTFDFKNTNEEKQVVAGLSLMWYEMHKYCV